MQGGGPGRPRVPPHFRGAGAAAPDPGDLATASRPGAAAASAFKRRLMPPPRSNTIETEPPHATSRKESIVEAGSEAGTVVLVHGGFVDGSGWQGVYSLLRKDGYSVSVVQNPTLSLEGDVAATKRVVDAQGEPVILVGHSYGGAGITEAGNDPNVAALVYIARSE